MLNISDIITIINYICNVNRDSQFITSPEIEKYYGKTKCNYSGLTTDEMIIPLIIIK